MKGANITRATFVVGRAILPTAAFRRLAAPCSVPERRLKAAAVKNGRPGSV